MKKYELNSDGRVVALRGFGVVKAGDVGGFINGEHNLSHYGDCWVTGDAVISEKAIWPSLTSGLFTGDNNDSRKI